MNDVTHTADANAPVGKSLLAQELIWTLGGLLAGLLVLPAMIYVVGLRMFGPYKGVGSATGLTAFYADYAHDIAAAHLPACTLAIGPLVLVYLVRLILGYVPVNITWWHKVFKKSAHTQPD